MGVPRQSKGPKIVSKLPLEGVRVLEASDVIAVPHAMGTLADMGAEVILVEFAGRPNMFRFVSPFLNNEVKGDFWNRQGGFNQWNRNKLSLTLDLTHAKGREIFRALVSISDVVAENFSARVMNNFGLEYSELKKIKEDIIMLSNTGFGHSGPWRDHVGMAQVVEAATIAHLTGWPDRGPSKGGQAIMDNVCSSNMVAAIMMALHYRRRTGKGQWIDHSMLQASAPVIAAALMDAAMNNRDQLRRGNRDPYLAPQGCYRCRGADDWLVLSIESDDQWQRLCKIMDMRDMVKDPRFIDVINRRKNHDELDRIIEEWTQTRDRLEIMEMLQRADIPSGAALSNKDLLLDPHLKARGYFEMATHEPETEVGKRPYSGRAFKLSQTPGSIRRATPPLGHDNESILVHLLGMNPHEVKALEEQHVISHYAWDAEKEDGRVVHRPSQPRNPPIPMETLKDRGFILDYDEDFKEILDI